MWTNIALSSFRCLTSNPKVKLGSSQPWQWGLGALAAIAARGGSVQTGEPGGTWVKISPNGVQPKVLQGSLEVLRCRMFKDLLIKWHPDRNRNSQVQLRCAVGTGVESQHVVLSCSVWASALQEWMLLTMISLKKSLTDPFLVRISVCPPVLPLEPLSFRKIEMLYSMQHRDVCHFLSCMSSIG